ncbi:fatty acid/sphingolipid desaturase, partial [Aureobasidium melanogenum]
MTSRNQVLSTAAIEQSIDEGHIIVVHEGYALKLDGWLNKHPGGRLAILHMVGRDATDEINVYHSTHTLQRMRAYRIGRIAQPWRNLEPPIRRAAIRQHHDTSYDEKTQGDIILDETEARSIQDKADALKAEHSSRMAFTSAMEQKEIAEGLASMPSVDEHTQLAIAMDFRALHERVKNEGFYDCPYIEYGKELIRYSLLFGTFIYFLRAEWYLISACFLGMFWQQIMFTAHDAGHRGITGNFVADTLIGAFIADFCCGLSIGWWKSSHNVHHLITNMPEHDPDLQNVPLFATSPTYFRSILSTFYNFTFVWDAAADFLVPYQKYTYYPIMAIARFNLYLLSWLHLMSPRAANLGSAWWTRPVEILFMAGYWTVFGYGLLWCTLPTWPIRVAFVLISHCITMLLHVQITLSHWGMPTADLGPTESFPQRQLRTTMDIDCPAWLDFLHGGLQFQAIHHLFPRVPRHNLRRLQVLVREFCDKTTIKYECYGFVEGNQVVLSRLEEVGKMVETLVKCQKFMAETGESGLH